MNARTVNLFVPNVIKPLSFFSFTLAAKTIATLPFIPGHECVGEVLRQNTSDY